MGIFFFILFVIIHQKTQKSHKSNECYATHVLNFPYFGYFLITGVRSTVWYTYLNLYTFAKYIVLIRCLVSHSTVNKILQQYTVRGRN